MLASYRKCAKGDCCADKSGVIRAGLVVAGTKGGKENTKENGIVLSSLGNGVDIIGSVQKETVVLNKVRYVEHDWLWLERKARRKIHGRMESWCKI